MGVTIRRTYEAVDTEGGYRVLVDRIWPRGLKKENLHLDEWLKELAPSSGLRKWFHHDPARWKEFRERYREELADHGEQLDRLRDITRRHDLVLLYSAKDPEHNQAVVLQELLRE